MATHKIGKLKFRLQDGGLDLRWGDGEIRRLGLKKKTENQDRIQNDICDGTAKL